MPELYEVTDLTPPHGIKPGVLPATREELLTVRGIDSAPGFTRTPISEWNKYIDAGINTSGSVRYISDQDGVGSCAAESCNNGFALLRSMCGLPDVEFNPWAMYYTSSHGVDGGSTLSENLSLLKNQGAVPMSLWDRSKGWRTKPSDEAYAAAKQYRILEYYQIPNGDWEAFGSCLLNRWPLYWGYSGHAIVGVDLLNTSQFRYLNSWGEWGNASPFNKEIGYGFGVVNNSSIMWAYGVYAFRACIQEAAV